MNLLQRSFLAALTLLLTASFLLSASALAAEPEGNARKGKYIYKNVYKDCSERGEVETAKPLLDPDSKTRSQWIRMFKKKKFEQFGCSQEWNALTEDQINNILAYLWKHAADSPTPAKCI